MQGDEHTEAQAPEQATSPHERAMLAKHRELAAHERAINRHEQAIALQERFGHPDRAATARRHAEHARSLRDQVLRELQEQEGTPPDG